MNCDTKAYLELLIHELQEALKNPYLRVSQIQTAINEILNSWITANKLHPERVQSFGPFTDTNTSHSESHIMTLALESNMNQ